MFSLWSCIVVYNCVRFRTCVYVCVCVRKCMVAFECVRVCVLYGFVYFLFFFGGGDLVVDGCVSSCMVAYVCV